MNQVVETLPIGKEVITLSPASAVVALWGNLNKQYLEDFKNKCLDMVVKDPQDKEGLKVVYEARQIAKNHRLRIDKLEKKLKADANTYRDVVGSTAKEIRSFFKESEAHLKEQEDIVKKEKERLAQEEEARKHEHHDLQIQKLIDAGAVFNGTAYIWQDQAISDADLWLMGEFDFEELLTNIKKWKAIEDTRIAEEERVKKEEADRQAKIAEENRIKQEALDAKQAELDAKEAAQKAAQAKIDADLKAQEDAKQKIEDDKVQAAKMEQFQKDEKARLEKESVERARIEDEENAKAKAEAIATAKKQAELAPDKEKLLLFVTVQLERLPFPVVKSPEANQVVDNSINHIKKLVTYINEAAEKL